MVLSALATFVSTSAAGEAASIATALPSLAHDEAMLSTMAGENCVCATFVRNSLMNAAMHSKFECVEASGKKTAPAEAADSINVLMAREVSASRCSSESCRKT